MDDIDRIIANLEYLSGDVADRVEKKLSREIKKIQADAKRLSPVDTGQLRNSITTGVKREPNGDIVATVGTNAAHAMSAEFGTGPIGEASPKNLPDSVSPTYRKDGWVYFDQKTGKFVYTKGQPARPFLYPAFKQNEDSVKASIQKAVKDALEEGYKND